MYPVRLTVKIMDEKGYVKDSIEFLGTAREFGYMLLDFVDEYPPSEYVYRIIEE